MRKIIWAIAIIFVIGGIEIIKEGETIGYGIFLLVIGLIIVRCLFKFSSSSRFDNTLSKIRSEGKKVTYANKNTGTISYKDNGNEVKSMSVYKGYNSHWKETKKK